MSAVCQLLLQRVVIAGSVFPSSWVKSKGWNSILSISAANRWQICHRSDGMQQKERAPVSKSNENSVHQLVSVSSDTLKDTWDDDIANTTDSEQGLLLLCRPTLLSPYRLGRLWYIYIYIAQQWTSVSWRLHLYQIMIFNITTKE